MNAREPAIIHKAFAQLRTTCDPRGHELLDELERWMLLDNSLLRLQHRLHEIDEEEPDVFSRKVPDTPGLRLVGAFGCDPDESCGQDGAA